MAKTVHDKLVAFLEKNRPKAYCDECLARKLGEPVASITKVSLAMSTHGASRAIGKCAGCDKVFDYVIWLPTT